MSSTLTSPILKRTRNFISDAADHIISVGKAAIQARGLFRLGLAGGNTPKGVYEALAAKPDCLPWDKVQITFGDERCVAPEDSASNFRMANEALLSKVPIPQGNVFRIRGEIPAEQAAQECAAQLAAVAARFNEPIYSHDLLLLGLGEDGHTASLFPGSTALSEHTKTVIPAFGPKPPPQRVSFTFPLINAAREVAFLVNDPSKEPVIQEVLHGQHPAGKVSPNNGSVTWIIGEK